MFLCFMRMLCAQSRLGSFVQGVMLAFQLFVLGQRRISVWKGEQKDRTNNNNNNNNNFFRII